MDFAELGFTRAGWDSPVLNPTASEASYKPKQRSYRKTNLKKKVLASDSPGAEISSVQTYPTRILGVINLLYIDYNRRTYGHFLVIRLYPYPNIYILGFI